MLSNTLPIALDDTPSLFDYTLPSKPSRRSQAHSRARSQVHSQLHWMTLPACFTVRSPVRSQDTPKDTSESLSSTLSIALDGTLPAYLALRPQAHSQEGRHSQSHLTICSHVCSQCSIQRLAELQTPGTGRREAGGVWRAAFGGWRVPGGRWQAAYICRNHDVGRYHSLNLIFSAATATRSHDASWSWC